MATRFWAVTSTRFIRADRTNEENMIQLDETKLEKTFASITDHNLIAEESHNHDITGGGDHDHIRGHDHDNNT